MSQVLTMTRIPRRTLASAGAEVENQKRVSTGTYADLPPVIKLSKGMECAV